MVMLDWRSINSHSHDVHDLIPRADNRRHPEWTRGKGDGEFELELLELVSHYLTTTPLSSNTTIDDF